MTDHLDRISDLVKRNKLDGRHWSIASWLAVESRSWEEGFGRLNYGVVAEHLHLSKEKVRKTIEVFVGVGLIEKVTVRKAVFIQFCDPAGCGKDAEKLRKRCGKVAEGTRNERGSDAESKKEKEKIDIENTHSCSDEDAEGTRNERGSDADTNPHGFLKHSKNPHTPASGGCADSDLDEQSESEEKPKSKRKTREEQLLDLLPIVEKVYERFNGNRQVLIGNANATASPTNDRGVYSKDGRTLARVIEKLKKAGPAAFSVSSDFGAMSDDETVALLCAILDLKAKDPWYRQNAKAGYTLVTLFGRDDKIGRNVMQGIEAMSQAKQSQNAPATGGSRPINLQKLVQSNKRVNP